MEPLMEMKRLKVQMMAESIRMDFEKAARRWMDFEKAAVRWMDFEKAQSP